MARSRIRFAFTIADGPNAYLTSGGWRVWVSGDTVYLTAKPLEGTWKVSLHGDSAWRSAVTTEHLQTENPVWAADQDRAPWKFEPTKFENGVRMMFALAMSRGALGPWAIDETELHIKVEDRWDEITIAYLWQSESGVTPPVARRPIGPVLEMANGRRVWLTAGTEPVAMAKPEPVPATAMIEPRSPSEHDVRAPGWLVRGVHLG